MQWMEWIQVRFLSTADRHEVEKIFNEIRFVLEDDELIWTGIFRNANHNNAIAICLIWKTPMPKTGKSIQGITLAAILEEFGAIHRSGWINITENRIAPPGPEEEKYYE